MNRDRNACNANTKVEIQRNEGNARGEQTSQKNVFYMLINIMDVLEIRTSQLKDMTTKG